MRQVECGLNLTVALTVDGRVWQMGETGAPAEKGAVWERTHVPVQARPRSTLSSLGFQALTFRVYRVNVLKSQALRFLCLTSEFTRV